MGEEIIEENNIWDNNSNEPTEQEERGEPILNRETLVSEIFETGERLERLKHRWRGDVEIEGTWQQKFEPLASDSFINKQISAAEGVIDKVNSISKKNDKEVKRILHDSVKAFILDCVDDESIRTQHMRTMAKTYEHSLELFLGLVEFGHGATVLSNTAAGLGMKSSEPMNKNGSVKEWIQGKLNR